MSCDLIGLKETLGSSAAQQRFLLEAADFMCYVFLSQLVFEIFYSNYVNLFEKDI